MIKLFLLALMFICGEVRAQVNIYLTFDDGPGPGSRQLYALADSEQVKINLFIVGCRALRSDSASDAFREHRSDSFILVANHSFTHACGHYRTFYADPSGVLADFDGNRDSLQLDNPFARMPGRNYWRIGGRAEEDIVNGGEAADSLASHGYRLIGWDIEWRSDTTGGHISLTGAGMLEKIGKLLHNDWTLTRDNVVILMHDEQLEDKTFAEKLCELIMLVRLDRRYTFQHLTAYPDRSLIQP